MSHYLSSLLIRQLNQLKNQTSGPSFRGDAEDDDRGPQP
jgi:hypothetical protein